MIAKIAYMIDKKITEVLPGNFIMNFSPDNLLQENNETVNDKKDFSS